MRLRRGADGERGKQGDHGQDGDPGKPGKPGPKGATGHFTRKAKALVIAEVLIISVVLTGMGYFITQNTEAHDALCDIRQSKQVEVDRGKQFLDDLKNNPESLPEAFRNIPEPLVQQGIDDDQTVLDDLADLNC